MNPEIHYNHETFRRLWNASDKVVYAIARQTLDMVGSSKATAYKSGETERSMYSRGVQKGVLHRKLHKLCKYSL